MSGFTMEQCHKDILRSNYRALKEKLSTGIEEICMDLFQEKILSRQMRDQILCLRTQSDQASALLDILPTRGPGAFTALYESCIRHQLYTAADILIPGEESHEPKEPDSVDNEDKITNEMLTENWPTENFYESILNLRLQVSEVEDKRLYQQHNYEGEYYEMTKETRGYPLLIYDGAQPFSMDRRGLDQLLKGLHFSTLKVKPIKNIEELKALERSEYKQCDCFVLFIISSGANSFLSSKQIVIAIINILKNKQNLAGKPKLIFHVTPQTAESNPRQSSNGNPLNTGAENDIAAQPEDPTKELNLKKGNKSFQQYEARNIDINKSYPDGKDDVDGEVDAIKLPKDCDVFYIKSNENGNEILESSGKWKGTKFILCLIHVFSKCAKCFDFYHLITLVNLKTTVAILSDCASKKLCFFPGCFEEDKPPARG